ncbi:Gustatory receptor 155 [Halyomorpha halys]|nr:Gustatory receptor 155 [Halyomorpha halys]
MAKGKKLFPVLQKILCCSQAFGTYPYNELLQTENCNSIYIVYQLILLVTKEVIAISVTKIQFDIEVRDIIFCIFISFTRFVISALPTINFVVVLFNRHLMKEIFENLLEVDSRLETLGYHPRYILDRKITYFASFLAILSITCFATFINKDILSYLDLFHFAVALTTTLATAQLITDLISIAGQQFQLINSYLSKSTFNQSRVEFFIELHNRVSLICNMLNKIFTKQMLVISFAVFFHTVITIHCLVDQYQLFYILYKILLMRILMTCVHLILGYSLVKTCVWTAIQSKDFTQILHLMVMEDETEKLSHSKKLSLHIALKREVAFTACGFFNLDFTLIHSMVAAAATYLVVLVQLGQQIDTTTKATKPPTVNVTSN